MSAYVVSDTHLQTLINAAVDWKILDWRPAKSAADQATDPATAMLRTLHDENNRSVEHRYPSDPKALPSTLVYSPNAVPMRFRLGSNPLVILKAINCLEYQSCEHPEWPQSVAFAFLQRLTAKAINRLPGYGDAEGWSIND